MALQWQYNPLVIPLTFSLMLVLLLLIPGLQHFSNSLARSHVYFMLCILVWVVGSLLEQITLNLELSLIVADLTFLGTTFFPVIWLSIVMIYNGNERQFRGVLPWLLVIPILTNMIIWTNPLHQLWRGEATRDLTMTWFPVTDYHYGPWFYLIHVPFGLVMTFVAFFLLIRALFRRNNIYRSQMLSIFIAIMLPFSVELLHWLGFDPIPHYNASILLFPISGVVLGRAIMGTHLLNLTPIARDLVVESMADMMLVLDDSDRVVDLNPAARQHLFRDDKQIIGRNISTLLTEEHHFSRIAHGSHGSQVAIKTHDNDRVYEVMISALTHPSGRKSGWLMMFRDITERKAAEKELYDRVQQIAILQERERMARDLHDSVNQTLFAARTLADLLPRALERKPEKVPEYAANIQQLLYGATAEMRLVLLELYSDALKQTDLSTIIKHLCDAYTGVTGTPVDFTTMSIIHLDEEAQFAFYRIAQEALNNISRHTQAKTVRVSLTQCEDVVELVIQDDGPGFNPETIPPDHFGLRNMQERAQTIGASLTIESKLNCGTTITVKRSVV